MARAEARRVAHAVESAYTGTGPEADSAQCRARHAVRIAGVVRSQGEGVPPGAHDSSTWPSDPRRVARSRSRRRLAHLSEAPRKKGKTRFFARRKGALSDW